VREHTEAGAAANGTQAVRYESAEGGLVRVILLQPVGHQVKQDNDHDGARFQPPSGDGR